MDSHADPSVEWETQTEGSPSGDLSWTGARIYEVHREVSQRCSVAQRDNVCSGGPARTCPATVSSINNSSDDSWLLLRCTVNDATHIKYLKMTCTVVFQSLQYHEMQLMTQLGAQKIKALLQSLKSVVVSNKL